VLSRDGAQFTLAGDTNIRAGSEIKVDTQRPAMDLRLSELEKGSWVIFQLPGFTKAAAGTPQASLAALRNASTTAYYQAPDALWVKVVSDGQGARLAGPGAGATSVSVSR
jgi:cell migration-inducing and hyaluronan-binding protein